MSEVTENPIPPQKKRREIPWWVLPVILVVLISGGIFGSVLATRDPQEHAHSWLDKFLWKAKPAYNFQLTDQDGKRLELRQFRGKAVVFAFGFASCPNICPTTLAAFASMRKALPENLRDRVQFLFISVDPERDTIEKLKEYVPSFASSFIGATGTQEELLQAAYEFNASFKKQPGNTPQDYFMDHSAETFLISPDGQWVMSYPFEALPHADIIAADIAKMLSGS